MIVGLCLVLMVPLLMRGVDVLRPVLTPAGQQVFRADGKPLYRHDPIGKLKVNWDAYTAGVLGLLCLAWSGTRGFRCLYGNTKDKG